jgi:hypothetical protein
MFGKKQSNESKIKQKESALKREKIKCKYCEINISPGMYKRWHGENCKCKIS